MRRRAMMRGRGSNTVTARSVVFDIADNWGDFNYVGVRSIEFKLGGTLINMPSSDFTAYATSFAFSASAYGPHLAFDTTLPKLDLAGGNSWLSSTLEPSRLIIVFNTPQTFDEIVVNNYHRNGLDITYGAKNVKITTTPDVYSTTTYNAAVTNGNVLNTSEWPQHVAAYTVDDQTVWAA